MTLYEIMREEILDVYMGEGWNCDLHRDSTQTLESIYSTAADWTEWTPSSSPLRETIDGKNNLLIFPTHELFIFSLKCACLLYILFGFQSLAFYFFGTAHSECKKWLVGVNFIFTNKITRGACFEVLVTYIKLFECMTG
jgi:hypothetical protein